MRHGENKVRALPRLGINRKSRAAKPLRGRSGQSLPDVPVSCKSLPVLQIPPCPALPQAHRHSWATPRFLFLSYKTQILQELGSVLVTVTELSQCQSSPSAGAPAAAQTRSVHSELNLLQSGVFFTTSTHPLRTLIPHKQWKDGEGQTLSVQ